MPKLTLQQRLVDALVATGRGMPVASRSHKYVTLKRPDGSFFYVGPAGALRFGTTVTDCIPAPDDFKRRLLEETGKTANQRRRNGPECDGTRVPDDSAENLVEDLVSCG